LGLIGFERGPEVLVDRDECVLEDALAEDSIKFIKTHFVESAVLAYLTLNDLESLISKDLLDRDLLVFCHSLFDHEALDQEDAHLGWKGKAKRFGLLGFLLELFPPAFDRVHLLDKGDLHLFLASMYCVTLVRTLSVLPLNAKLCKTYIQFDWVILVRHSSFRRRNDCLRRVKRWDVNRVRKVLEYLVDPLLPVF